MFTTPSIGREYKTNRCICRNPDGYYDYSRLENRVGGTKIKKTSGINGATCITGMKQNDKFGVRQLLECSDSAELYD